MHKNWASFLTCCPNNRTILFLANKRTWQVFLNEDFCPQSFRIISNSPTKLGKQTVISSSHLENTKATILFGESDSIPVDKMQFSLLLGKAPKKISIELTNSRTSLNRESMALHIIVWYRVDVDFMSTSLPIRDNTLAFHLVNLDWILSITKLKALQLWPL